MEVKNYHLAAMTVTLNSRQEASKREILIHNIYIYILYTNTHTQMHTYTHAHIHKERKRKNDNRKCDRKLTIKGFGQWVYRFLCTHFPCFPLTQHCINTLKLLKTSSFQIPLIQPPI